MRSEAKPSWQLSRIQNCLKPLQQQLLPMLQASCRAFPELDCCVVIAVSQAVT